MHNGSERKRVSHISTFRMKSQAQKFLQSMAKTKPRKLNIEQRVHWIQTDTCVYNENIDYDRKDVEEVATEQGQFTQIIYVILFFSTNSLQLVIFLLLLLFNVLVSLDPNVVQSVRSCVLILWYFVSLFSFTHYNNVSHALTDNSP